MGWAWLRLGSDKWLCKVLQRPLSGDLFRSFIYRDISHQALMNCAITVLHVPLHFLSWLCCFCNSKWFGFTLLGYFFKIHPFYLLCLGLSKEKIKICVKFINATWLPTILLSVLEIKGKTVCLNSFDSTRLPGLPVFRTEGSQLVS